MPSIIFLTPSRSIKCGIWTYTHYLLNAINGEKDLAKQAKIDVIMDFKAFQEKVTKRKPDLVHLQDEYGIVPEQILYWLRDKKLNYVITLHTVWSQKKEHHDELEGKYCKKIILHSEDQLKVLKRTHPKLEKKCVIIPHGSFIAEKDNHTVTKGKRIVFGAFGFASPAKRFLETFDSLKKSGLDFEYRILSSYPQENIGAIAYSNELVNCYKQELIDAEALDIEPRFYLNNRFLKEEQIIEKLKRCDILISAIPAIVAPSVSGSSRFLMQAARPVIVSESYHYSDVPEDTFVKIHSSLPPLHFKEATEQILENYEGYIEKIYQFTLRASWQVVAHTHFDIYNKLIKK